jgi:hypothetical protein
VGQVLELQSRKSWSSGVARCLLCGCEEVAVAPAGVVWMECSRCHAMKSAYVNACERDGAEWRCGCGNDLFHVKPEGVYCPNCGEWQEGF